MINVSVGFKKLILISFALMLGALTWQIHAQDIKIKVSKDSTTIDGNKNYSITLRIQQGSAPFNIAVFKDKPGKKETMVQHFESYNSLELKIENIVSRGIYYIAISSTSDGKGKLIHISI